VGLRAGSWLFEASVPGDEDAATEPRERTLTDSRRRSPASSWSMAHVALDAAVATAYGGL